MTIQLPVTIIIPPLIVRAPLVLHLEDAQLPQHTQTMLDAEVAQLSVGMDHATVEKLQVLAQQIAVQRAQEHATIMMTSTAIILHVSLPMYQVFTYHHIQERGILTVPVMTIKIVV
jgi:uncharacterized protein with PQ loop repeat